MKHRLKKSIRRFFDTLYPGTWSFRALVAVNLVAFTVSIAAAPTYSWIHLLIAMLNGAIIGFEIQGTFHRKQMALVTEVLGLYEATTQTLVDLYHAKQAELDRALGFAETDEAPDTLRNPPTYN